MAMLLQKLFHAHSLAELIIDMLSKPHKNTSQDTQNET